MTENAVVPQTRPTETVSHQPESPQASKQPTDIHSGLVSDTALGHLALNGQPFAAEIADGEWFSDDTTREQLVDIKEALISGDDLLLISGEAGSGKSVLLKQLSASGGTRIQCFSVRGSKRFSTFNLFSGLLEAFKLKPPAELEDTLKEVIPCLQALAERNMLGVIVLDDADKISDEELSMLLGSVQYLNRGEDPLLRILMAAESDFEARLPELLPTSSDLPYASLAIEPFDIGRAAAYLDYRLGKVGDLAEFPFSDQQMHVICDSANGLPSRLNIAAAAQINQLYHSADEDFEANELIEEEPFIQSRPIKFALGALGTGLVLASAYLFIQPTISPTGDEKYAVVSNKPIDTSSSGDVGKTDITPEPERITLVEEPKTDILVPAENESTSAVIQNDENNNSSVVVDASPTDSPTVVEIELAPPEAPAAAMEAEAKPEIQTPAAATTVTEIATQTADEATTTVAVAAATQPTQQTEPQADNVASENTPAESDSVIETETNPAPAVTENVPNATSEETSTPESTEAASVTDALLESANWVLVQDPELYTVQMSASRQRSSVESFLVRSKLDAPNSIFSFKRGDSTWYALVHGLYPTITEARTAIENMPATAKSNQPWIRAIAQIQNSVKNQ